MSCGHTFYKDNCYSCRSGEMDRQHKQRMRQADRHHRERMSSARSGGWMGGGGGSWSPPGPLIGTGTILLLVVVGIPIALMVIVVGAIMTIVSGVFALIGLLLHSLFWAAVWGAAAGAGAYWWKKRQYAEKPAFAYARPEKGRPVLEQIRGFHASLDPVTAFAAKVGAGTFAVVFLFLFVL